MGAELNNIPNLDGWVNLTEAAEMLGFTRQHAFKKARQANEGHPNGWRTIRRIGSKPLYVVSIDEVEQMLQDSALETADEGPLVTDLAKGTLSREDRKDWLRNYGFPDDTADEEILLAMGSGLG